MNLPSPSRPWSCTACGFTAPWWVSADRFPLCVDCEAKQRRLVVSQIQAQSEARAETPRVVPTAKTDKTRLEVKVLSVTQRAVRVCEPAARRSYWLPRVGLMDGKSIAAGYQGEIRMKQWLAQRWADGGID